MTKSTTLNLNLNGSSSVTGPSHYSKKELEHVGLKLVRQALERNLSCSKTGITVSMKSANIFADSGAVNVGGFHFEVHHHPNEMCSGAKVAIEPKKNTFGHGYYTSLLGAYVSPDEVFVTVSSSSSDVEEKIVSVKLDGEDLLVNVGHNLKDESPENIYTFSQIATAKS
jgi:hypothetical protein